MQTIKKNEKKTFKRHLNPNTVLKNELILPWMSFNEFSKQNQWMVGFNVANDLLNNNNNNSDNNNNNNKKTKSK